MGGPSKYFDNAFNLQHATHVDQFHSFTYLYIVCFELVLITAAKISEHFHYFLLCDKFNVTPTDIRGGP